MKLPRSITIAGRKWKVKELAVVVDDDGIECHGTCDKHTRTIEVEKNFKDKLEVFFHEWMHAVLHESGLLDELPEKYSYIEHLIINPVAHEFQNSKAMFNKLTQPSRRTKQKK